MLSYNGTESEDDYPLNFVEGSVELPCSKVVTLAEREKDNELWETVASTDITPRAWWGGGGALNLDSLFWRNFKSKYPKLVTTTLPLS